MHCIYNTVMLDIKCSLRIGTYIFDISIKHLSRFLSSIVFCDDAVEFK